MEQREILSFLIGCCVMAFVLFQWSSMRNLPHVKLIIGSFVALFASWGFSVVEALFWETGFNFLQHLFSGIGGIFMALWCRAVFRNPKSPDSAP